MGTARRHTHYAHAEEIELDEWRIKSNTEGTLTERTVKCRFILCIIIYTKFVNFYSRIFNEFYQFDDNILF